MFLLPFLFFLFCQLFPSSLPFLPSHTFCLKLHVNVNILKGIHEFIWTIDSGPCSADLLINNKLLPYLPKYETLKTTSSPWKCEAQLSDAEHLQTQPPISSIFAYGLFFFLDKNLNHWNLEWNFKDFVPMRSYKIRKVESFKSGVLDIWIDIEYKPSCAGCICSFWTSWFVLPEVLCVCLRMQRQNPLWVSNFYWIQRPMWEQS